MDSFLTENYSLVTNNYPLKKTVLLKLHRHQTREDLDAVPVILQTDVLVLRVLIVVVVRDRHCDRRLIERFGDDRQRQASAESRHSDEQIR